MVAVIGSIHTTVVPVFAVAVDVAVDVAVEVAGSVAVSVAGSGYRTIVRCGRRRTRRESQFIMIGIDNYPALALIILSLLRVRVGPHFAILLFLAFQ